jgi:hypothetical protein
VSAPTGLDTQQIEIIARNWLTTELVFAGYEVAMPIRDSGVDLLVSPSGYGWTLPVQVKTHRGRKLKAYNTYLGRNVVLAYVLLGEKTQALPAEPGDVYLRRGNDYSPRTIWFTPEEAWAAPSAMGLEHDVDLHPTYFFHWTTSSFDALLVGRVATHRSQVGAVVADAQRRLLNTQSLRTVNSIPKGP